MRKTARCSRATRNAAADEIARLRWAAVVPETPRERLAGHLLLEGLCSGILQHSYSGLSVKRLVFSSATSRRDARKCAANAPLRGQWFQFDESSFSQFMVTESVFPGVKLETQCYRFATVTSFYGQKFSSPAGSYCFRMVKYRLFVLAWTVMLPNVPATMKPAD